MFGIAVVMLTSGPTTASAEPVGPIYDIKATWGDTNLPPGLSGRFLIQVRNIGDADGHGDLEIVDDLPEELTITRIRWTSTVAAGGIGEDLVDKGYCPQWNAAGDRINFGTHTLSCRLPGEEVATLARALGVSGKPSGYLPPLFIDVGVASDAAGTAINVARVSGGGGAAAGALDVDRIPFHHTPSGFGVVPDSFTGDLFDAAHPFGLPVRQAGAHPFELRLGFDLNAQRPLGVTLGGGPELRSHALVRTVRVSLPRGIIANPTALPRCLAVDLESGTCPPETQVGYLDLSLSDTSLIPDLSRLPLYNVHPPAHALAEFAFSLFGTSLHVYPVLDPARGYATEALIPHVPGQFNLRGAEVVLWGVPGDPANDRFRRNPETGAFGAPFGPAPIRPLITNSMDCDAPSGAASIRADSYTAPEAFTLPEWAPNLGEIEGCEDPRIRFEPRLSLRTDQQRPSAPGSLTLRMALPQRNDEVTQAHELYADSGSVKSIATPALRRVEIALPEGMSVNPSLAQGLGACNESQIGLVSKAPPRFDGMTPSCPESARIGSLDATTPILARPIKGSIYLAEPDQNALNSSLALYLVLEDQARGLLIKIPGRLDLDPVSGQITIVLDELPQLPFDELSLRLKPGPRAPLLWPSACGRHAADYALTSWADSSPVRGSATLVVDNDCDASGLHPSFSAGSVNAAAGATSPFSIELGRDDRAPNFSGIELSLPQGVVANFKGVPLCPDALAASGACPDASRIGSATLATGAGFAPLWIPQPGAAPPAVFLAGFHEGAPFSLVLVIQAQAGPLDLGTVALRAPIAIDPRTAEATIRLMGLPQILSGVRLPYRTLHLLIDRPGFVRNPTSCKAMQVRGTVTAADGTITALASRFQAADCATLPFRPQLDMSLSGSVGRNGHPALRIVLTTPGIQAGLRDAAFTLPVGQLLNFHRLRAVCDRGLPPERCPRGARLGHVRLWSPALEEPLRGPVYARESHHRLPDLIAAVRSGPVRMLLHGYTATRRARLRIGLHAVPDVPLSRATITLAGGRRGILANTEALCRRERRATATFTGHNGKRLLSRPRVRLDGRC